jgi:amino acid adenylation domain-containing protein
MKPLLQTLLTDHAQRRPDAVALAMPPRLVTYGQLEDESNRLARLLRDMGLRPGDCVGILMPKSPDAVLGFLGVLKADCVYVPIDPASPPGRIEKIVRSCELRWILAAGNVTDTIDQVLAGDLHESVSVAWVGEDVHDGRRFVPLPVRDNLAGYCAEPPQYRNTSADAAHILFTSGSTGTPKGVVVTHANVLHFVDWGVRYFGIGPTDRNSGHSPLHFDLSTFDIYGTLAAGAQLRLVPPELNVLPNKLADFMRGAELTQWFSAPSALNLMAKFDVVRPGDFPSLKRLLWCGEVFPTPALVYWMRRLPHVAFTNLYGPTEATIASSYHTVAACPADDQQPIPIGAPCAGEGLLVLDDDLRPVAPGTTGGLFIHGVGLSPGYWRDPEKTAAAFVRSPHVRDPAARLYRTGDLARVGADGLVYFLGRADSQIKCRGHRIELGEIECALNAVAGLRECAVVAVDTDGFEGKAICCAYVPADGAAHTPATLRRELGRALPAYMLPSRWRAFADGLPKNVNGKTDRTILKEQFAGATP